MGWNRRTSSANVPMLKRQIMIQPQDHKGSIMLVNSLLSSVLFLLRSYFPNCYRAMLAFVMLGLVARRLSMLNFANEPMPTPMLILTDDAFETI
jgi:hypothetical protein